MNVSIWNKQTKKRLKNRGVKDIFQTRDYFELGYNSNSKVKRYSTDIYELTFIHSEV